MSLKSGSNIEDWNSMWDDKPRDLLERLDEPQNWEDISWKSNLQLLEEIFMGSEKGSKFLECGCGQATVSRYVKKKFNFKVDVIDSSNKAIELARDYFEKHKLEANYHIGDIQELPFNDSTFDIIYSGGVIEYFDEYKKLMAEMSRVLKKGGIFCANIVPKKFSVQTIGDIEMTIAQNLRAIMNLDTKNFFKITKTLPGSYNINKANLNDYLRVLKKLDYSKTNGFFINPYPNLFLPKFLKKKYVKYLVKNLDNIKKFNKSQNQLKKFIGISYLIYGIK